MRFTFTLASALCVIAVGGPKCLAADGKLGVELVARDGKVVILSVIKGSGAERIGIQPGDVLSKVGATKITSIQAALDAKAAASNNVDVPMIIETPGGRWDIKARFEAGQPYGTY